MRNNCVIALVLVLKVYYIQMDCGFPALPESTKINLFKRRYDEYSYIEYECDTQNKELVGNKTIRCLNGRWIGTVPKCALEAKLTPKTIIFRETKPIYRFLSASNKLCYKPEVSWNLTSNQKWVIQFEGDSSVDYFSLLVESRDLITNWKTGNVVMVAKVLRPRKVCYIDKLFFNKSLNKTQISFICNKNTNEMISSDLVPQKSDSLKVISFEVQSKNLILVTFCSIKTYSFSDSCGSPEKPLHSIELIRDKSFTIFSCEEDFYLEPMNSQKVICGQSGNWNKQFPKCVSKTKCRLPAIDSKDYYINVEYKDLNFFNGKPFAETNSIAIYSCRSENNTEIKLIGENKRVCKRGLWAGTQPICQKNVKKLDKRQKSRKDRYSDHYLDTSANETNHTISDPNWNRIHIIVISMLFSFIIGALFIGFIVYVVMKYMTKMRAQIPSVVVSEPNIYYERNIYEEYRYESVRLSTPDLNLERINSLYQINNEMQPNSSTGQRLCVFNGSMKNH